MLLLSSSEPSFKATTERIGQKFSLKVPYMPGHGVCSGKCDPILRFGDIRVGIFGSADSDKSVDYHNFFSQMEAKCDADHKQTVLNIFRFLHPPNRRSGGPIRSNPLTIFNIFQPDGHRMRCWQCLLLCFLCSCGITGAGFSRIKLIGWLIDDKQTLSNIMRFLNPSNRRLSQPIRTNRLTIFIFFSARWTHNATLTALQAGGLTLAHNALVRLVSKSFLCGLRTQKNSSFSTTKIFQLFTTSMLRYWLIVTWHLILS